MQFIELTSATRDSSEKFSSKLFHFCTFSIVELKRKVED